MMPRVIGNNSLIERVNEVEGVMYRQSNELGRLNRAVKKYKDENTKLRELVEDMLDCIRIREAFGRPPTSEMCEEFSQRASELGIEVD